MATSRGSRSEFVKTRILIGAGGLGGYFGGCLIRVGRDVTFLVRPRHAEPLPREGLQIIPAPTSI
jgi:ketopantoate reductase